MTVAAQLGCAITFVIRLIWPGDRFDIRGKSVFFPVILLGGFAVAGVKESEVPVPIGVAFLLLVAGLVALDRRERRAHRADLAALASTVDPTH